MAGRRQTRLVAAVAAILLLLAPLAALAQDPAPAPSPADPPLSPEAGTPSPADTPSPTDTPSPSAPSPEAPAPTPSPEGPAPTPTPTPTPDTGAPSGGGGGSTINPQAQALASIRDYFKNADGSNQLGWPGSDKMDLSKNPCDQNAYAKVQETFPGVSCNGDQISSIDLSGFKLKGSIPSEGSIWSSLPGLTTLSFAGSGVSGPVPATLSGAPQLSSINLSGNPAVCGTAPTLTGLNTAGTAVGTDCAAVGISPALESPPLTLSPSPDVVSASPKPAAPSPTPSGVPVGVVASPKPSPPPVQISNQPVCTCAMAGYGSDSCKGALTTYCATKKDPACDTAKSAGTDAAAATTLSQLLQRECFAGQDMTADACSCTTNVNSNECAKGRVALCLNKDPACLPFQGLNNATASAADQAAVAAYAAKNCALADADRQGVRTEMTFTGMSVADFYAQGYPQKVANALSSVTGVRSSDINVVDVRPVMVSMRRRRSLQQTGGQTTGVRATFFVTTNEPDKVSSTIESASTSGGLGAALQNQGINTPPRAVSLRSFVNSNSGGSGGGSSGGSSSSGGFPMWAIGVIVGGAVGLLLLLLGILWCCKRKARKEKAAAAAAGGAPKGRAAEYAPSKGASYDDAHSLPVTSQQASRGVGVAVAPRDEYKAPVYYNDSARVPSPPPSAHSYEMSATANGAPRSARQNSGNLAAGAAAVGGVAAVGGAAALAAGSREQHAAESPVKPPHSARSLNSATSGSSFGGMTPPAPVRTSLKPQTPSASLPVDERASAGGSWQTAVRNPSSGSLNAGAPREALPSGPSGSGGAAAAAAAGGAAAAGVAGVAAMSSGAGGANPQQAERAKFWAQFQDLMTQVNTTKQRADEEPDTPSSGTNWTETEVMSPPKEKK